MGGKCCSQVDQKQLEINLGTSSILNKDSNTNELELNINSYPYDKEVTAGVNRDFQQINHMKMSQGIQTVSAIFQDKVSKSEYNISGLIRSHLNETSLNQVQFHRIKDDMNFEVLVDQMIITLKEFQQVIQKKKKEQFKTHQKKELPEEWLILFAIQDYLNRQFQNQNNQQIRVLAQNTHSVTTPTNFRHSWSLTNNNINNNNSSYYFNSNNNNNNNNQNQQQISNQNLTSQKQNNENQNNKYATNKPNVRFQVLKHFNSESDLEFKISEKQQNILSVIFMRIFYTIYSKKHLIVCQESAKLFEVIEFIALNFIRLDQREVKYLNPEEQLAILIEIGKFLQLYGNHQCTLNYYNVLEMDFHRTFSKQFIKLYELQALNLSKLGKYRESITKYNLALTFQEQEEEKSQKEHQLVNQKEASSAISPTISRFNLEENHIQKENDKVFVNTSNVSSLIDKGLICYQIAQIYSSLKEFDNAIEYYQKSLDYNQKSKDKAINLSYKSITSYINNNKNDEIIVNNTPQKIANMFSQQSFEQLDQTGAKNIQEINNSKQQNNIDIRNCSILQSISQMYFQKNDLDQALEYLKRAYEKYQKEFKLTEQTKYIKLLTQMCSIFSSQGKFSESIKYAEEALTLIEQKYGTQNFKELKSILENLQILYLNEKKILQSLEVNKRLIKLVEENNVDDLILAQYLENNGTLNYKIKNYEESLRSSYFALKILKDQYGEKSIQVAKIQQNIAQTLSQQNNHKIAFEMAKSCLEIFSQNTQLIEQEELSYVLYNIAQFALNVDLKEEAFNYIKQSKELLQSDQCKQFNNYQEIIALYNKISKLINQ
ncbi:tetratricopeptide repeat protein (macronuclear) [Tetrahymena thermophila SB210]|uniref:Tetratricopeptide repeat protein n=1 Tax=Tetrahymena thermophila (strain SB210) TaxID=312017 RepID=I7M3L6_TETTS|nr:tetratricopeptide repeat protein [Tetrahymena thermophila SB210]EAS03693.2 tetratricopeptide repeat protein [Tetrahymena thermophila SB210]|eukprot:XP_001023938.2 tetratricopeptide repeat protein [Tetrahymena thermophila SB210]